MTNPENEQGYEETRQICLDAIALRDSMNKQKQDSPEQECEHKWVMIPIPRWIAKAKGADDLPDFYRCAICGKESKES